MLHLHPRHAVILIQSGHLSHEHRSDNLMAKKLRICRWFPPRISYWFHRHRWVLPPVRVTMNLNELLPGALLGRSACFLLCLYHGQAVFDGKNFLQKCKGRTSLVATFQFQEGRQTRKWKCNLEHLEEKSATITLSGDLDGPYLPSNLNWSKLKLRDMFDYRRYLQVSIVDFQ